MIMSAPHGSRTARRQPGGGTWPGNVPPPTRFSPASVSRPPPEACVPPVPHTSGHVACQPVPHPSGLAPFCPARAVNCTIDTCRQNYHVECMTEFLLARAAQLDSWRSREKYEVRLK